MKHEEIHKLIGQLIDAAAYYRRLADSREAWADIEHTPQAEFCEKSISALSSLLEENKRMKEAFGEVFFEWLHLHDVADSMDLAACVEIEDHEKFEEACRRARSALKEAGND